MNNGNLLGLYNLLYNELNALKEKVDKLSNNQNSDDSMPNTVITDMYFSENKLNIVKYDRKNKTSTTLSIKLNENISTDDKIVEHELIELKKNNGVNGVRISSNNFETEINKIFKKMQ